MEFLHEIFKLYEEVQKSSDFARISHEAVVHPKSELHYLSCKSNLGTEILHNSFNSGSQSVVFNSGQ